MKTNKANKESNKVHKKQIAKLSPTEMQTIIAAGFSRVLDF